MPEAGLPKNSHPEKSGAPRLTGIYQFDNLCLGCWNWKDGSQGAKLPWGLKFTWRSISVGPSYNFVGFADLSGEKIWENLEKTCQKIW